MATSPRNRRRSRKSASPPRPSRPDALQFESGTYTRHGHVLTAKRRNRALKKNKWAPKLLMSLKVAFRK
jgi:hypothetical protein